jgi:hypothetical protein
MIEAVISVVITGRRMQTSEIVMSGLGFGAADDDAGAIGEQKLTVGHHGLTLRNAG